MTNILNIMKNNKHKHGFQENMDFEFAVLGVSALIK